MSCSKEWMCDQNTVFVVKREVKLDVPEVKYDGINSKNFITSWLRKAPFDWNIHRLDRYLNTIIFKAIKLMWSCV